MAENGDDDTPEGARESRGIQSIEVGGRLLLALVHAGRPMPLKDLAREADMTPAKAHPYLVSFGKLKLIEQDPASGRYGLGALALQLGLIGLQQSDPVRLASAELPALALAVGQTVGIAIWGNRGPTFVRLEEGPTAVHVNMRHGTVVSVRGTASGRLFAAFMPRDEVLATLRAEAGKAVRIEPAFEAELAGVREQRFSSIVDGTVRGITALAAPVFDGFGEMVIALTAIGPSAILDPSRDGAAAQALIGCAEGLSRRMGARPAAPT
ncbi:IclR family transcriptional regulator [Aquincola sp. S2]|uniref:IclR family transcriptional regulator n=1 Tax=Pseudaquabacterium terrae TaxID=2732868 RepID=A0ABX2ECT4_9BURK|nr:IclR family transcriptional regulator [Aquabacterium terrae]NRF65680.1 IclR family transcriptional regulator [Aquabacterium terrae]